MLIILNPPSDNPVTIHYYFIRFAIPQGTVAGRYNVRVTQHPDDPVFLPAFPLCYQVGTITVMSPLIRRLDLLKDIRVQCLKQPLYMSSLFVFTLASVIRA